MNLWKKHVFQCSLFMIFGTCFFIRLGLYHWRTSWFHSSAANYLLPLEPHQIVQNCTNWNLWLTEIIPMCNFYNHCFKRTQIDLFLVMVRSVGNGEMKYGLLCVCVCIYTWSNGLIEWCYFSQKCTICSVCRVCILVLTT